MVKTTGGMFAQGNSPFPVRKPLSFLFVAINAKFVHTNLAVRYLKNNCKVKGQIKEYSINDDLWSVCGDIYKTGIKYVMFSCYIWNISYVLKICSLLKKADENITICLGGPEVSFRAEQLMTDYEFLDCIMCGEGEKLVNQFADAVLSAKCERMILKNDGYADLNELVFPYKDEDISQLKDRIIYYETSRGCPFNCSFCLSGADRRVRYLNIERVKGELDFFIQNGVRLVKFVDRTFNANAKRALEIIEYIKSTKTSTKFHFEIKAEIMTDELIESLSSAPVGMFQIEIGVQSTDDKTLKEIGRKADVKKIADVVSRLRKNGNVHLHLDLIAGLPHEDLASFIRSFNETFLLKPHDLQLGFLKKLSGSSLDAPESKFSNFPPYEIISSDKMTYDDLLMLKATSDVLEKYYNSGSFPQTMEYIISTYFPENPFDFFRKLGGYFDKNNYGAVSKKTLFEILYEYTDKIFSDKNITKWLIIDYCSIYRDNLSFMPNTDLKERAFEFLKNENNTEQFFSCHSDKKPVKLYKQLRFLDLDEKFYVFDYMQKRYFDITNFF